MEKLYFETKLAALDSGEITGTAWQFSKADRIGDIIEKGAFNGVSLPLPMLFSHDMSDPIGTWDFASEQGDSLEVKGKLLVGHVKRADEVFALVKAGAVKGISVGFNKPKFTTRKGGGRTIKSLELLEISLVTVPMHPDARVHSAKSAVRALSLAEIINRAAVALSKG